VDAVVEPVGADEERAAGEQESAPCGGARRDTLPQHEQHGRPGDPEDGETDGRKGRRQRESRGQRKPLPAPGDEI
jgi:hypothetical protein